MPSPHPAVTPDAIAIAKRYGKNVSRGIVEMEKVIQGQQMALDLYHKCDEARKSKAADPYMPTYKLADKPSGNCWKKDRMENVK